MPTTTQAFSPEAFRSNWQRRDSFVWYERPDDAEEFGLWVLSHRDSGLIAQSNAAAIRRRLAPFTATGDVLFLTFSHWLVGSTSEVAVRVYQPGTQMATEAFEQLARVAEALEDYPLLDESDHSRRQYESALDGIECAVAGESFGRHLPGGWRERVYRWLDDHDTHELEDHDDRGAFPAVASVKRALVALGLTKE